MRALVQYCVNLKGLCVGAVTQVRTIGMVFLHAARKRQTLLYPEEKPDLAPRYRGRPVLTRDPNGVERCVGCGLCAVVCPVDCIALQQEERESGQWFAKFFRLNMSRCVFCGLCEEACPTSAIQLTPDFELGEYRREDLVLEKEDLLISGTGKDHSYSFRTHIGRASAEFGAQWAEGDDAPQSPVDTRSLLP